MGKGLGDALPQLVFDAQVQLAGPVAGRLVVHGVCLPRTFTQQLHRLPRLARAHAGCMRET